MDTATPDAVSKGFPQDVVVATKMMRTARQADQHGPSNGSSEAIAVLRTQLHGCGIDGGFAAPHA